MVSNKGLNMTQTWYRKVNEIKKSKKLVCVKGPDSKGNESQSKERENFKKDYETELWYGFDKTQVNSNTKPRMNAEVFKI